MTDNSNYLQLNDKYLGKLERQTDSKTLTHVYNQRNRRIGANHDYKHELEIILTHFAGIDFPRTISTKTTEGRQVMVNDKEEALARFKQANYLDCRINAYSELDHSPNFIFIDIDIKDSDNNSIKTTTIEDNRTRLQALALANDCYKYKMDLVTNGVVITDAIKFVQQKKEELTKVEYSSKENTSSSWHGKTGNKIF